MADGTIDRLVIDISSDANQAVANLDRVVSSLDRIATAASSPISKLNSIANTLNKVKQATAGLNFSGLQQLSGLKISSTLPKNLTGMVTALNSLSMADVQRFSALTSAMARLRALQGLRLTAPINQLAKLPPVLRAFTGTNFGAFIRQINALNASIGPLARNVNLLATAVNRLPRSLRTQAAAARTVASTNKVMSASLYSGATNSVRFMARCSALTGSLFLLSRALARCINESNTYIENMNLFQAAMGQYAGAATEYAQKVQDAMGIDAGEWMRNQGVFQTLATGMGVAADKASVMSQQLTQLGYDISSFYNMDVETAMTKIQSGIAGELEPLRRIGWDLSNARMQLELTNMGIDANVQQMTQAQKVALRYKLIMEQVSIVHGDMARTIASPANQLRVLRAQLTLAARSIGNVLIPMMNMILPYAIAAAKAIRILATEIAKLLGIDATFEVDYSSLDTSGINMGAVDDATDEFEDMGDQVEDTEEKVKKLKNTVLGFDELNKLNAVDDTAANGAGNGLDTTGKGIPDLNLPLDTYDFMQGLTDDIAARTDEMAQQMVKALGDILPYVSAIAAGFAAWQIAKSLMQDLYMLRDVLGGLSLPNIAGGLPAFLADMNKFAYFFKNFLENGPTFYNVAGMLSEFAGMLGDCFWMFGNLKLAGVWKIIQGLGEIAAAIYDISQNGINWDNVWILVNGLSDLAIGIGLYFGNTKLAGASLAIQGLFGIVRELAKNWEAIKNGDWSGVDQITMIVSVLEVLGGLALAFDVFGKLKHVKGATKAGKAIDDLAVVTQDVDTKFTGGLSPKLKSLAKNLGMGLVVIAEVAAAAGLVVGAIIGLGYELSLVPDAWQPVLDNGPTITMALLLGGSLMLAIASVTNTLGQNGKQAATNIGIGTGILAEIGVATGLFLAEIWAIGWGLDQIAVAWQPVLDNGESIVAAVAIGTGILAALALAAFGLGAIVQGSGTTIPVAIGIGAAVLVEIGAATAIFLAEIWGIGWGLDQIRQAWQPVLDNGEDVAWAIGIGVGFLAAIALVAGGIGAITVASGGTIALAIGAGALVLAEIGLATAEFLAEIWGIGWGLQQIITAWQPVLDNGEIVEQALGIGVGYLTGIAVVAGGLGTISILSGMFLPAAIAVGAGVLLEMAGAFVTFCDGMIGVSQELRLRLAPELAILNPTLPKLKTDSEAFANGMSDLSTVIGDYTNSMGSVTWDSIVGGFMKLFAGNPIGSFADDVGKIGQDTNKLNAKLAVAVPELRRAVAYMSDYTSLMDQLEVLTKANESRQLAAGAFVNLEECGRKMIVGLVSGMEAETPKFDSSVARLSDNTINRFNQMGNGAFVAWNAGLSRAEERLYSFCSGVESRFNALNANVGNAMSAMGNAINNALRGVGGSTMNMVISQWNNGLAVLESSANSAVRTLNSLIRTINSVDSLGIRISGEFSAMSFGRVPYMASGGLLNRGQLFVARERGPELIGAMGNQSAVANNDQIVEGIEQGVMSAMMQVMMLQGAAASERETVIEIPLVIGNEEVARASYRGNLSLIERGELIPQFT